MSKAFQAEFVEKNILKIIFDLPGSTVNLFNAETVEELNHLIEELKADANVKAAYVVSGKEKNFSAGAEVQEIYHITSSEDAYAKSRFGQMLFERWRQLPFPTLAAIDGACMGGGTEWALAFTYRMGSDRPETRIGLPEVKLGIIPGWGGTVRLPRLIGVKNALKLILNGEPVSSAEAYRICLTDDLAPHKMLDRAAVEFLQKVLASGDREILQRRRKNPERRGFRESFRLGRNQAFRKTRNEIFRKTGEQYPALLAGLQAVMFSCDNQPEDALMFEARKFAVLAASPTCRNLLWIYFLNEEMKKSNGVENREIVPEKISRLGILGAGEMGSGLAYLAALNGHPVRLKDAAYPPLSRALASIWQLFERQVSRERLTARQAELKMDLLSPTIEYSGFARADLVMEALPDDRVLKKEILKKAEECTREGAILTTAAATFPVSEVAKHGRRPERLAGFTGVYPVHKMRLVEIVPAKQTSDQTVATLYELAKQWGKFPVVVQDHPGFLLNRLLAPYLAEALALLESGAPVHWVDLAMIRFGMPRGPFQVLDEMGREGTGKLLRYLQGSLGKRFPRSALLEEALKNTRAESSQEWRFYLPGRSEAKKKNVNRGMYKERKIRLKKTFEMAEIQDRLLFLMINEAAICLEEKIVERPGSIDAATLFGMGFPKFRGGLLRYADSIGIAKIMGRLWYFSEMVGERYAAAPLLKQISESGKEIYEFLSEKEAITIGS